jgi:hypothetical protein
VHGHGWHIGIDGHGNFRDHSGGTIVELSYPNCSECFDPVRPTTEGKCFGDIQDEMQSWSRKVRSGQIAASNGKAYRACRSLGEGKAIAVGFIRKHVVNYGDVEFDPQIEAYMYHKDSEYAIWPHTEFDIFNAVCQYDVPSETVVHIGTGVPLIRFGPNNSAQQLLGTKYCELLEKACAEFSKTHVQKDSELDTRGWLAWLLSEYIRSANPDEPTVRVERMVRR